MKSDAVFKRAFNDALALLETLPPTVDFPSENQLSAQLRVSRTTVRKILAAMKDQGFEPEGDRRQSIVGIPRFAEAETVTTSEQVETHFMEWMLRDNTRPGTSINELELARRFGLSTIPQNPNLSIALGAYEVPLIDLVSGYQVFQNQGQRVTPYVVDEIRTTDGRQLFTHVTASPLPAYDIARASMMVKMMQRVITSGTGTRANFGRPAAGRCTRG